MKSKIYLGADHAGFSLKEKIKKLLKKEKIAVVDLGAKRLISTDDYPDYAYRVAKAVARTSQGKGILICGSGQGMCIVANKVKGVRAVVISNQKEARLSRLHNNANILCLSAWQTKLSKAYQIIKSWLETPFSNEPRHLRRLEKIKKIEERI
jgi:ribose 5-phosphate isomerase B